jgi:hypothetical protein
LTTISKFLLLINNLVNAGAVEALVMVLGTQARRTLHHASKIVNAGALQVLINVICSGAASVSDKTLARDAMNALLERYEPS